LLTEEDLSLRDEKKKLDNLTDGTWGKLATIETTITGKVKT